MGAPVGAAAEAERARPRGPARVRRRDRARAGEGPRRALPVRRRPRPRRRRGGREPASRRARAAGGQGRGRAGRVADRHGRGEARSDRGRERGVGTQLQPEAETRHQNVAALATPALAVAGAGCWPPRSASSPTLTLGDDSRQRGVATRDPDRDPTATRDPHGRAHPRWSSEITVGRRPNVVRVGGGQRLRRLVPPRPHEHRERQDRQGALLRAEGRLRSRRRRRQRRTRSGSRSSRSHQVVRLDARSRPADRQPDQARRSRPNTITAAAGGAIWVGLVPGADQPDQLVRIDPRRARSARRSPIRTGSCR